MSMGAPYRAEILAIGDELLSGETVDTNSSYLDGLLEERGWTVQRHVTVPDDVEAIRTAIAEAASRCDLIISTGGLGPTQDDLTLEGLSLALGVPLELHAPTLDRIAEIFRGFGRPMTPNNQRQAMVPQGVEVLVNEVGTAPCVCARFGTTALYALPGVPREVRWLWKHRLGPRIEPAPSSKIRRTIKVLGLGESSLEHRIREVIAAHPDVLFGFRTKGLENQVKMMAEGPQAQNRLAAAESALAEVLGSYRYGADGDQLEVLLLDQLAAAGQTVAVAESCTGGGVMERLTAIPGASRAVLGGVVVYANAAKVELVGVPEEAIETHGAVSEPVVRAMAEGVRSRLGASWGLAVTGIAGPEGGTPDKPVGTVWFAVSGPEATEARSVRIPGDRDGVRARAGAFVLDLLRRRLMSASVSADRGDAS